MLLELNQVLKLIQTTPNMLDPENWDSLVINRRKPFTYRAFKIVDDIRICLHKFDKCTEEDAFFHPHPWPSAMIVLAGSYKMCVGYSNDKHSKPDMVLDTILAPHSRYSMMNPLAWHSVQPLETCFSIMVNGQPWDKMMAHEKAPTTKGKDLDKMAPEQLKEHLGVFKHLMHEFATQELLRYTHNMVLEKFYTKSEVKCPNCDEISRKGVHLIGQDEPNIFSRTCTKCGTTWDARD